MDSLQIDRLPLQPVARPTEQFTPPEVRAAPVDNDMLALGQALRQYAPGVEKMAYSAIAQNVENIKRNARQKEETQYRFENKQAFTDAVKAGKVPEADNPWAFVEIAQSVKRREMHDAYANIQNEYFQSDIQHSDDLNAVKQWVQQRTAPLTKNVDTWEQEVVGPAVDEIEQRMLDRHVGMRSEERLQELAASVPSDLRPIFEAIKQNPEKGLSQFQEFMSSKGQILHWSKLNPLVYKSVADYAVDTEDPDLFDKVVGSMKTPGGSLLNTEQAQSARRDIETEIVKKHNELSRAEESERELRAKTFSRQIITGINQKAAAEGKSLVDVGVSRPFLIKLAGDDGDLQNELLQWFEHEQSRERSDKNWEYTQQEHKQSEAKAENKQLAEGVLRKATRRFAEVGGNVSTEELKGWTNLYSLYDPDGGAAIKQANDNITSFGAPKTSDDSVLKVLAKNAASNDLSFADVLKVKDRMTSGDFDYWSHKAQEIDEKRANGGVAGTDVESHIKQMRENIGEWVTSKALAQVGQSKEFLKTMPGRDWDQIQERATAAQQAFDDAVLAAKLNFPGTTPDDRSNRLKMVGEVADRISTAFGGYSSTEYLTQTLPKKEAATSQPAAKVQQVSETKPANEEFDPIVRHTAFDATLSGLTTRHLDVADEILKLAPDVLKENKDIISKPYQPIENYLSVGIGDLIGGPAKLDAKRNTGEHYSQPLAGFVGTVKARQSRIGGIYSAINNISGRDMVSEQMRLWTQAQDERKLMKSRAESSKSRLMEIISRVDSSRGADGKPVVSAIDISRTRNYLNNILRYEDATRHLGLTDEEAKDVGDVKIEKDGKSITLQSWKVYPLFASKEQLKIQGYKSAQLLGLKDNEIDDFFNAQSALIGQRDYAK